MSERLPSKKPWPMKWIVVAILACIIPYTWLTLRYRKPGPAFEPYHDTKERAQVKRLVDAGMRRVPVQRFDSASPEAPRPPPPHATPRPISGGVPETLRSVLIDSPHLPLAIGHVTAPSTTRADAPYPLTFTYETDRDRTPIARSAAYLHEREVTVVVEVDSGNPVVGEHTATETLLLPPKLFDDGTYTVTLIGQNESQTWQVEAK